MGNLCSIFHSRFKNLTKVIPSTNKARLVDYILLGWQTSTYRLKGSDKKWFMKPYLEIKEDLGLGISTIEKFIKELADDKQIVRRHARYSTTTEAGEFKITTGTYIYPTEELLDSLKPVEKKHSKQKDTHNDKDEHPKNSNVNEEENKPDCSGFNNKKGSESLFIRDLYIRDLYPSFNNNIKFKKLRRSVDNQTIKRLVSQFQSIQKLFDTNIKEEIPKEVKKLVIGTFFNLTFEHKIQFSSPKQIAAEFLYALINVKYYLPKVTCFEHRNNSFSKIIRENRWKTPKGFYKHFYLGQTFKDKQDLREKRWQEEKNKEMTADYKFNKDYKDERLLAVEQKITEKAELIEVLTESIYEQSSEEMILIIREKIEIAKKEIESLWNIQSKLEKELERASIFNDERLCA